MGLPIRSLRLSAWARTDTWAMEQRLWVNPNTLGNAARLHFGTGVAIDDNRIVVGAPDDLSFRGSAYDFRFFPSEGMWVEVDKLRPTGFADAGRFGTSVSLDDFITVIGAPRIDLIAGATGTSRGAAFGIVFCE